MEGAMSLGTNLSQALLFKVSEGFRVFTKA